MVFILSGLQRTSDTDFLHTFNLTPNHQLQPIERLNFVLGFQRWYVTFAIITDIYAWLFPENMVLLKSGLQHLNP